MTHALRAEPDLIAPNVDRGRRAGRPRVRRRRGSCFRAGRAARHWARATRSSRPATVAGPVLDDDPQVTLRVHAPELDPITTVGSGDALVAGLVSARYIGLGDEEALRYAVACGAESTQHFGAGTLDRDGRRPSGRPGRNRGDQAPSRLLSRATFPALCRKSLSEWRIFAL